MRTPPTITFRRFRASDALQSRIQRRIAKLETYCPSLIGARVLVEPAHRRHRGGNRYRVRIDLSVPNEDLVISHAASLRPSARAIGTLRTRKQDEPDPTHKMLNATIGDAFNAARRRLQDYVRRQRPKSRQSRA